MQFVRRILRGIVTSSLFVTLLVITVQLATPANSLDNDAQGVSKGEGTSEEVYSPEKVTTATLHVLIEEILAGREFQFEEKQKTTWILNVIDAIRDWWGAFLKGLSEGGQASTLTIRIVSLVLGLLLITLVIKATLSIFANRTTARRKKDDKERTQDFIQLADNAEKRGDLVEALRYLYREALRLLFPHRNETSTSNELISELMTLMPAVSQHFKTLTHAFNRSFYGGKEVSRESYTETKTTFLQMREILRGQG